MPGRPDTASVTVGFEPLFELSPYLYMQFMEPLGTTDSSVEAGWDFARAAWRDDFVAATRELRPSLIRWPGGILSSYYRLLLFLFSLPFLLQALGLLLKLNLPGA